MDPALLPSDSTPRQVLQAVLTESGDLELHIRESLLSLPFENSDDLVENFVHDVGGAVCAALDVMLDEDESLSVAVYPLSESETAPEGLLLSMEVSAEETAVEMAPIIASEQQQRLSFNVVHAFRHLVEGSVCADKSAHGQSKPRSSTRH